MPLEVEVKFLLTDTARIRHLLLGMGALSEGRIFETNLRFEDSSGSLERSGVLLRLRQDRRVRLTYKGRLPETDTQFKVHRELEVEVSDFTVMEKILRELGFSPVQRYEKWRETLRLDSTVFCIDSLPFGEFLEIEGDRSKIINYANQLGLEWPKRIIINYLEIFALLQQKERLPFSDISFDNFRTVPVDLKGLLPRLEAG